MVDVGPCPDRCPGCGVRCDACSDRMCSEFGPAPALTCPAHRICEDCDDASDPCRDCATARRADAPATTEGTP